MRAVTNIGGSTGGHVILDTDDVAMTERSNLKFGTGLELTDDATNDITQVDIDYTDIQIMIRDTTYRTDVRFKNLGTRPTSTQIASLRAGDLTWAYNGDFWNDGTRIWRVVDNTGIMRRRGNTNFDEPSLVIFPDSNLISAEAYLISADGDSTNGYSSCAYRTRTDGKGRAQCKSIINSWLNGEGSIAAHRELMSSAKTANGATNWAWTDADVELPSEANIYGHSAWSKSYYSNVHFGGAYNIGTQWGQFALFRLAPYMAINRSENYWLRDIVNASYWAFVNNNGIAGYLGASDTRVGLRPFFILA